MDMKLGPATKIEDRNKTTSKKFEDDVISAKQEVIVIFPIYGQFVVIRMPPFERIVCKTFSLIVTSYLKKTENKTEKYLAQLSHYCFE